MIRVVFALFLSLISTLPVVAQDFRALARIVPEESFLRDEGRGLALQLSLTQAVPYRVFTLDDPRRLVLDFRTVSFDGMDWQVDQSDRANEVTTGRADEGWSRLVVQLSRAMSVEEAGMVTSAEDGTAVIQVMLSPASDRQFAEASGLPAGVRLPPVPVDLSAGVTPGGLPMIAIDPGHGGVDPGAQRSGQDEADLMLVFAIELREVLLRSGQFDAVLTREGDWFVSLPERVTIARAAGADAFLSLHADALAEGRAHGATVYTLSETASDAASAALAESHNRADLLAGVDLAGSDDEVADVLIDLARQDTAPRSEALAEHIVGGLRQAGAGLHPYPLSRAGFSVLKAADIPSILIELGFMSDAGDLANLNDATWRAEVQEGIRDALIAWHAEDEARAALLRQ